VASYQPTGPIVSSVFTRNADVSRLPSRYEALRGKPVGVIRNFGEVTVSEGRNLGGLDRGYFPTGTVYLVRSPIRVKGGWLGESYKSEWDVGTTPFVPSGSSMSFVAKDPFEVTSIDLGEQVFIKAARDVVDLATVQFDFRDLTTKYTARLIATLSDIASDADMRDWPLLMESISASLAVAILYSFSHAKKAFVEKPRALSDVRGKRVLDYIGANIHRQITLAELAEIASLSQFHFIRKFKNRFGMTPLQYLAHRRVESAKRMLVCTREPLAHIAVACGFASQSHFSTVFRKVQGTTPAAYRKAEC
jgi:AraC family transcriptional regulator